MSHADFIPKREIDFLDRQGVFITGASIRYKIMDIPDYVLIYRPKLILSISIYINRKIIHFIKIIVHHCNTTFGISLQHILKTDYNKCLFFVIPIYTKTNIQIN
jgi:hypothetical protein